MRQYGSKTSAVHDTDPDTTAFRAGWPAWLGILGSVWLIFSPFVLVYFNTTIALANTLFVGLAGFICSVYCAYMANRSHDKTTRLIAGWLLVACGVWLILAPFVLNFSSAPRAFTSSIITGIIFVGVALYGVLYHSRRFDKSIKADVDAA